ncbi:MAG: neutral zinc metallopeptidase, partial [Shewanella sp.]
MRWRDSNKSSNIEDRRGQPMAASAGVPSALLLRLLPWLLKTKLGRVILLL